MQPPRGDNCRAAGVRRCAEVRRDGPRAQLGAVSAAADDYVATTSPLQSAEPAAEDADAGEADGDVQDVESAHSGAMPQDDSVPDAPVPQAEEHALAGLLRHRRRIR